jgi:UDP-3-O-[3-hydroxymyristoyl] glucosamine N-acyltransferase
VRIPQIGSVIIEDDVEIGALSNVARGAIDDTIIRRGVIVDDHCHIGHGSELGEYTVMVGRSALGGSVKIGKRCLLLQDSGLSSGRAMGDESILATNVRILYKDVPAGTTMQRPVITHPAMTAKRIEATLPHLPAMRRQLRELEARLDALTGGGDDG